MSKLEEKFEQIFLDAHPKESNYVLAERCAILTKQECIGFAEWIVKRCFIETGDNEYWSNYFTGRFTISELFQLYQKNKENGK